MICVADSTSMSLMRSLDSNVCVPYARVGGMEEMERRTKAAVSSLEHQVQLEKVDFENGMRIEVLFLLRACRLPVSGA